MPACSNQRRFASCRASSAWKRLSTTRTGHPSRAAVLSRTALITPRPASATRTTESGASACARVTVSPSWASGERTPPTPSTTTTSASWGARSSAASSVIVKRGRPRRSAAMGGAIATSYQRWGGHTSSGRSPVAAARTSASVAPAPGVNDCAGLRAATRRPRARRTVASRAATHVLPTSVPVPVIRTSSAVLGRRTDDLAQGAHEQIDLVVGVGGRERHPQPRGAGGHGRRADRRHEQAPLEQGGGSRQRPSLLAQQDGDDRRRVPRRHPFDVGAQSPAQPLALLTTQHGQGGEGGGGVGRRQGGGEDERPGPVDEELDERPRAGDEPAQRAEG